MCSATTKVSSFEDILELVGTKGRKNFIIFFGACIGSLITSMHTFAYQFLGATPDHWCLIPEMNNSTWTTEEVKNISIPFEMSKSGEKEFAHCTMRDLDYGALSQLSYSDALASVQQGLFVNSNESIWCSSRQFEEHPETIVTKWDLVCGRRSLYSTSQAAVQFGMLIGALCIGYLIDRFGRLSMYKVCVVLYIIGGFVTAVSPNIEFFILLKVLTAMIGHGFYMAGFLLSMEICSIKQRSVISTYYPLPWALGIMITPGIAYLVPTWYWMEVALTVPGLLLLVNFRILPESPRWLIINKRYKEAAQVLQSFATSNSKSLLSEDDLISLMGSLKMEGSNENRTDSEPLTRRVSAFFRNITFLLIDKSFRFMTICIFFCWMTLALVYYGVTLGSVVFSDNPHLYLFLAGLIEIPSYALLWPAVSILGRKKTFVILQLVCASSIFIVMALIITFEEQTYYVVKMIVFLGGKLAVTAAFHLAFVYTAELYPTNYRSLVIGEANAMGRAGSVLSPYINDLLGMVAAWGPGLLFGVASLASGLIAITFPETSGKVLPETQQQKSPATEANVSCVENPSFVEDENGMEESVKL